MHGLAQSKDSTLRRMLSVAHSVWLCLSYSVRWIHLVDCMICVYAHLGKAECMRNNILNWLSRPKIRKRRRRKSPKKGTHKNKTQEKKFYWEREKKRYTKGQTNDARVCLCVHEWERERAMRRFTNSYNNNSHRRNHLNILMKNICIRNNRNIIVQAVRGGSSGSVNGNDDDDDNDDDDGNSTHRMRQPESVSNVNSIGKKMCFSAKRKCGNSAPIFKHRIMYISFESYHVISRHYIECVFSASSVLFARVPRFISRFLISSFSFFNFNFEFTIVYSFFYFIFCCWFRSSCSSFAMIWTPYTTATVLVVDLNAIKTWISWLMLQKTKMNKRIKRKKTNMYIRFHMICGSCQSYYFYPEREMIIS